MTRSRAGMRLARHGLAALLGAAMLAGCGIGASAKCRDGTYSHSKHRSGTCSHHGGVAEWY
ncbi:MAG TPA: DUF3761 domain-containing protein [Allosphingosinicella sp.]|jgi:hypothetical protein|nr:DUF3761 domain-containing protein [Allosphingosinicella sp.]